MVILIIHDWNNEIKEYQEVDKRFFAFRFKLDTVIIQIIKQYSDIRILNDNEKDIVKLYRR